jgi:hypothetical protein
MKKILFLLLILNMLSINCGNFLKKTAYFLADRAIVAFIAVLILPPGMVLASYVRGDEERRTVIKNQIYEFAHASIKEKVGLLFFSYGCFFFLDCWKAWIEQREGMNIEILPRK